MSNKIITLEFDNEKDAQEVLVGLSFKQEITWGGNSKKAMMKVFKKENKVLISKSVVNIPQPLRL